MAWIIEKKTSPESCWETIYNDYSEAKTRRQFLKYRTNLKPAQALRLSHRGEVIDETAAPPTRLTPLGLSHYDNDD